jgi:hypothetical protein
MFTEYVKFAIDERERSVQELLRERRLAEGRPSEARWRSASRAPKHPNRERGR